MSERGERPAPATGTGPSKNRAAAKPLGSGAQCRANDGDLALSQALREYGIAKANENGDAHWRSCFDAALDYLAKTGRGFSTDDVFLLGVPSPDHPNRVGAAISAAAKAGVIRAIGYQLSSRPSRHAGVVRVWIGGAA